MKYVQHVCIALLLLSYVTAANASTYELLKQQVHVFENSKDARFVPVSLKRVQAYLGAAMLAEEKQASSFQTRRGKSGHSKQSEALSNAIAKTKAAFAEVKSNVKAFKQTYAGLLQLEKEAKKAYVYHHSPQMIPDAKVKKYYEQAQQWVKQVIAGTENGQLNQARQDVKKAKKSFFKCMDAAMSGLVEQTSRAISGAASAGAKRYTPRLWGIASAEFGLLKRYHANQLLPANEKVWLQRPEKPAYAFEMATYAQSIALQVKSWRRDKGSHEALVLAARQDRLDMAQVLGLPLDFDKVGVDVENKSLMRAVKDLQETITAEREQHQIEVAAMKAVFEQTLRDNLYQQRVKDQRSFQDKMSKTKKAFRAKLEQETFEKKRQNKLRSLFQSDEVEVIAHLNGSLMIRTKIIQFASASSQLDSQYLDLLQRIKEAFDLYPQRHITIEGHTDNTGNAKVNRQLSLERAEAVQEFLLVSGIDSERVRAVGYGEAKPIATNMYKEGRAMNRRIDFVIEAANHE